MQGEYGTLFVPGTPFRSYFLHNQYTHSIASGEQGLREILKYDAAKEQRAELFATQKSVFYIICILHSNEVLRVRENQVLADRNVARR